MRSTIILLSLLCSSRVFAASQPPAVEIIQMKEFNGRRVAETLALSCSEKNFTKFAAWAGRTRFLDIDRAFALNLNINFETNSVSVDKEDVEFKMLSPGKMQARVHGKTYLGEDSCALIMAAAEVRNKVSLQDLFLPKAYAADVSDSTTDDTNRMVLGVTGAAAGIVVILATSSTVVGTVVGSAMTYASTTMAHDAYIDIKMKGAFADILKNSFKATCSNNLMTIESGTRKILITQDPPTVQMLDNGKVVVDDKRSRGAEKSRAALLAIAKDCPQKRSPAEINKAAAEIQKTNLQLITAEESHRPLGATGTAR